MPEGQYSGDRATYLYVADSDDVYLIELDTTLGDLVACALTRATSANSATAVPAPKRFQPRVVYWQGLLGGVMKRKRLVCNRTGTIYDSARSLPVTIDGTAGNTTGRRGEKLTFVSIPAAGPE